MNAPIKKEIKTRLRQGSVGVLPTDTLYGLVGSAFSKQAVQKIYRIKRRDLKKPFIVLIRDLSDLKKFGVTLSPRVKKFLNKAWPGKVSVILGVKGNLNYLHRGTRTIAFRLPRPRWLRALLREVGPLVAPSANMHDKPPAKTIRVAKKYFGTRVDFYVDSGSLTSKPSTLVALQKGKVIVIRKGAVAVKNMVL